jgi:CRISPR-associated protein Cas1
MIESGGGEAAQGPEVAESSTEFSGQQGTEEVISHALPEVVEGPPELAELPKTAAVVEPLPARMLNEFVYCPRLFYYEHVEGVFVDNADTVRGAAVHARVDKGSGAMPPPDGAKKRKRGKGSEGDATEKAAGETEGASDKGDAEAKPEIIHSRSAMLGSERLGVIAKLDLVEMRAANDTMAGLMEGVTLPMPGKDAAAEPAGNDGASGAGEGIDALPVFEVCPVDYKAGAPREGEDGNEVWPTDRMQLGLQMLLLKENGYRCQRGIIYYRATKQRVPLEFTDELETWVISQIEAARRTMTGPIPPPLVGSPKCVRCSLNSVCLPDETRLLAEASAILSRDGPGSSSAAACGGFGDQPRVGGAFPRRLMAPRDDKRVLYLNKPGVRVGRKDELLTVKEENRTLDEVRIGDLTHVALFGNIQISTQAVQVLCELEVPLTYFSMGGWFYGITRGHQLKNVFTRMEQFRLARDPAFCLALARRMVNGKIRNHRTMLMRLHLDPPAPIVAKLKTMADSALQAQSLEELLGTEGAAAHFYFGAFSGMLKAEDDFADIQSPRRPQLCFNFAGRNRRPPTDPVNALLSLGYSLLAKDCTLAAMAVGLDPYVGFYHQPRFGRPALALDLMEEFRPLIAESAVLTCINNRMILPRHFVQAGQAVNLSVEGRRHFVDAYEQRMRDLITHPIFEYKVSYRRVVELQFRLLARYLTGEIAEYPPFVTR